MTVYALYDRRDMPICVLDTKEDMADYLGVSLFWLCRCLYYGDCLRDGMAVYEIDIGYLHPRFM